MFKDASTNKGGVTSSSLEVLASLAFDDAGYLENMCVKEDGAVPAFYQQYVESVQATVKRNARAEFECLWREHQATGTPRSILSDRLSTAITGLSADLQGTALWDDETLRRKVLTDALPALLLDTVGFDLILQRVPESYLRSIFGSYLASKFVYEKGVAPGQFAFWEFMRGLGV